MAATSRKLTDDSLQGSTPNWSPDGEMLLFNSNFCGLCPEGDIYVMRRNGSSLRPLTANFGDNLYAFWSPDSEKIAFTHWTDRQSIPGDIYVTESDGSGTPVRIPQTARAQPIVYDPSINDQWPAWQPIPDAD